MTYHSAKLAHILAAFLNSLRLPTASVFMYCSEELQCIVLHCLTALHCTATVSTVHSVLLYTVQGLFQLGAVAPGGPSPPTTMSAIISQNLYCTLLYLTLPSTRLFGVDLNCLLISHLLIITVHCSWLTAHCSPLSAILLFSTAGDTGWV